MEPLKHKNTSMAQFETSILKSNISEVNTNIIIISKIRKKNPETGENNEIRIKSNPFDLSVRGFFRILKARCITDWVQHDVELFIPWTSVYHYSKRAEL